MTNTHHLFIASLISTHVIWNSLKVKDVSSIHSPHRHVFRLCEATDTLTTKTLGEHTNFKQKIAPLWGDKHHTKYGIWTLIRRILIRAHFFIGICHVCSFPKEIGLADLDSQQSRSRTFWSSHHCQKVCLNYKHVHPRNRSKELNFLRYPFWQLL